MKAKRQVDSGDSEIASQPKEFNVRLLKLPWHRKKQSLGRICFLYIAKVI
jgi:hypothetical protein